MIFDDINSNAVCPFDWNGRYILSDIRKALIAICSKYNFNQYLCHRHIIHHFSANSILGNLCRKVLKAYDSIV